ncbi:MAG: M48 family metallopeptidase [Rickettsiales bacterium]|jgi:heat shock protein HtpX|nr:M48 family metallopeptidase [Rickettsiales bacterium]
MNKNRTVYDHIKSNNRKTIALVLGFPLIFSALVFLFVWIVAPMADAVNTMLAVSAITYAVCLIWLGISWAFGDEMMLRSASARETDDKKIIREVENVALAAGLPTPRVYVIEDDSLNAFATGRGPRDASIALTRGIIAKLDRDELRGVIAHEMAHIGNRDIRLDMLVITGVGVTVFAADIIGRMVLHGNHRSNDDKNNSVAILGMVWLAFLVFNWIITPILRMAISRKREFAADATGAFITRNPRALASALQKISIDSRVEVLDNRKSMAAVCIANPTAPREFMGNLFATHPKTTERIKRLNGM